MNTEPLVPAEIDLRDFQFMPLDVLRLRDSELSATPDAEAFRCCVLSWCVSWHQIPAGSLPDDDATLARLLGFGRDVKGWKKVRAADGLRGWVKCSDGRLYHPVVAEKAIHVWNAHHRLRHLALRKSRPKRIKGSRWAVIRSRILARDGHSCRLCGSSILLEIDHIKPLAEGGSNHDDNLQVLCRACNRRKSYKWNR